MSINVKLSIPDELLSKKSEIVSREILEQFVIESYKLDKISTKQIQHLLGFKSRFEVEDFLHKNKAFGYTLEDLEDDLKTLKDLGLK
ncbi:MAG: UPF0175 family protein [Aridibacter sp.]